MASDADAAAELVLLYQAADSNLYWTSCALALLLYDYLLTFRHELRFVWGRKFSAATVLFLLNRYFIILLYVVDVITLFPIVPATCPGVGRFITVLEVIPYIIWATFSALRAYALSSRTAAIGVTIFALSLVPAGVNAYFFSTFTFMELDAPSNCTALSDITPQLSKTLTIVSRAALMAADIMVIAVTWASTYRLGKASREVGIGASFGALLLRDGTIYFVVLVAMNVVHMTLNTVKPNNIVQQASYVTVLENPITSILTSRFILNLRAVDQRGGCSGPGAGASDTLYGTEWSTPSFVRPSPSQRVRDRGRGRQGWAASTMRFASVASVSTGPGESESGGFVDVLGAPLEHGLGFGGAEDGDVFDEFEEMEGGAEEGWGANPEKAASRADVASVARDEGEVEVEERARDPTGSALGHRPLVEAGSSMS